MDYADKLPPSPWDTFAPPRRYIIPPPLTGLPGQAATEPVGHFCAAAPVQFYAAVDNALLARAGLPPETTEHYSHELNASQRQRVVIARALALEPKVLIADEPIAKLDVSMQGQILNLIDQLRRELDLSVIFITHDLSVVRQIATRVAVLYLGQLMELQETESFFKSEGRPHSQALLRSTPRLRVGAGDSALHTIKGEIPSPIDVPPGCPFLSRCSEGDDDCGLSRPPLLPGSTGGLIACFKRDTAEAAATGGTATGVKR